MPTYSIAGPDGKTYSIDGPEGATREQIVAAIKLRNPGLAARAPTPPVEQPQQMPARARQPITVPEDLAEFSKQVAQEQSFGENLMQGLAGGMSGIYHGARQMMGIDEPGEVEKYSKTMKGLRTSAGGMIGDILGQTATAAPLSAIPGAGTAMGAALIGGALGAAQPVAENESRLVNTVLGGVGGYAGQKISDKLARILSGNKAVNAAQTAPDIPVTERIKAAAAGREPVPTPKPVSAEAVKAVSATQPSGLDYGAKPKYEGLSKASQNIFKKAEKLDLRTTPGQASGSQQLMQREASAESIPMFSKPFTDLKSHNQTQFNRITAKWIGENADTVDNDVLASAYNKIEKVYKKVADDKIRTIDSSHVKTTIDDLADSVKGLKAETFTENSLVKGFINLAESGQATGKQLQDYASKMGNLARSEMTSASGDRELAKVIFKLKDTVDDYLKQGLDKKRAESFANARQHYKNLMLLTKDVNNINPTTGDVNMSALAKALQRKDKAGFVRGKNQSDMYTAARFAQATKPIVGNSGTATRASMMVEPTKEGLWNLALSVPGGMMSKAYLSSPVHGAAAFRGRMAEGGLLPGVGAAINPAMSALLPLLGGVGGSNIQ